MLPIRPRPARFARPVRTRLPRTALPWWLAVGLLALLTGTVVNGALRRAEVSEARWGRTRGVLVATSTIAAGSPLHRDQTANRRLPAAMVPAGALVELPPGRVALATIAEGEIVIASRVSGERAAGTAALLPPGTRALMVPLDVAGLPVRVGDRVDLLATGVGGPDGDLPADGAQPAPADQPVAEGALVVAVQPDALVVAVDRAKAPEVAAALGQGPVIPALTAPEG